VPLAQHTLQVSLTKHENVIDALATNAPEKALAEGVHPGDPHGSAEYSDARSLASGGGGEAPISAMTRRRALRDYLDGAAVTENRGRLEGAGCTLSEHDGRARGLRLVRTGTLDDH
jgi:hypothetical protein